MTEPCVIIGLDPIILPNITENIAKFLKYQSVFSGKIAVSSTAMTKVLKYFEFFCHSEFISESDFDKREYCEVFKIPICFIGKYCRVKHGNDKRVFINPK